MQLSLYSDYSCRVLIYLAASPTKKASIDQIASAYGISTNHLVKVVHNLGKLGFIETSRGRGGGISLSLPPETLNIGDVIRKTEPTLALVECMTTENTCPIASHCGLRRALLEAREAFLKVLDNYSLKDICRSPKALRQLLQI